LAPAYFPLLAEQGFFWPEAVDSCDPDPELDLVQILIGSEDLECPLVARAIWQFTAIDACGNESAMFEVVCDFADTTPPVLVGVPEDVVLGCFDQVPAIAEVSATDSCDDSPSVVFGEVIDDAECPIVITRTWTATDACENETVETQTITFDDQEDPIIDPFPIQVWVECDEVDDLTITASDECSEIEITYEDLFFSGGCLGTIQRTWIVTDGCGNTATALQFIIIQDTTPPMILGVGEDMEMDCSETPVMPNAWAEDNCGYDVDLSFVETVTPGDCDQEYSITWTWTAIDYCENEITLSKTVTVTDSTPPSFDNAPGNASYDCSETIPGPVDVTATDDCGTAMVSLDEQTTPGNCPQNYTITRTWTATDNCENSVDHVQTITVSDTTPPTFTSVPQDVTIECSDALPTDEATADDDCGVVTVTSSDSIIPTDCESEYTLIRTFYAEDECGNISDAEQVITVEDNTAPELSDYPDDVILDCEDEVPAPPAITALDLCDGAVDVDFTETFEGEFPDAEAEEHCKLISPESTHYDPDWAMWLQELPEEYQFYQLTAGDWKQYDDGTAHLEATVVSTDNANGGFIIDVWFNSEMNWDEWSNQAFPTSYKDDWNEAGLNYLDWIYYLMDNNNATLTGWGDFEDSFFTLEHAPSGQFYGYQLGVAANNVNTNFGSGGWFSFEGQLVDSSTGYDEFHVESGDFAFDHDCCLQYEIIWTWTATDCAGNTVSHTMNTSFENLNGDSVAIQPEEGCKWDFDGDGYVGTSDLLMLLTGYGCESNCAHDLDGDDQTNTSDMLELLTKYGTYCE
jgi:hypothetical protein